MAEEVLRRHLGVCKGVGDFELYGTEEDLGMDKELGRYGGCWFLFLLFSSFLFSLIFLYFLIHI